MADWKKIINNIDHKSISPWYIKCLERLDNPKFYEKDILDKAVKEAKVLVDTCYV